MRIDIIGNIYILDVIVYYDKPLVFSCINDYGQYFIASCNELEEVEEWIFVPLTQGRLTKAIHGNIMAYELFKKPEGEFLWKIKINANDYSGGKAVSIEPESLLDDDLPDKDIVYDIYGEENFSIKKDEQCKILDDSILERREILDISLESKDSHVHEIDVEVLGKILNQTQNIINLIAYKQGTKAKVPKEIKEKNKLNVSGAYAASLGIRLKANNFANILNESEIQESLSIFMDILECKSDTGRLTEIFKELNPSVSIYYKNLLKLLCKEKIGVKTYCAFPNNKYRKNSFRLDEVNVVLNSLEEQVKEIKKEMEMIGDFVAIDITNKKFKFITNYDEIICGTIGDNTEIAQYVLLKKAKIKLEMVCSLNDFNGKQSIYYKLLELKYLG